MTRFALDCAWAPFPSPDEATHNGFEGYARYLATKTAATEGKLWTPEQIVDVHSHGMWTLGVWEEQADRPTYGKSTGVSDAHAAEDQWLGLGAPTDTCVAYAYDFDPDPQSVLPYAEGVREAAELKVMAYCSDAVAVELFNRGLIDFFWQTESTGFRGRWPSPIAHMIQHVGYQRPQMTGDYDENTVIKDFAWWPPHPKQQEDDMPRAVRFNDGSGAAYEVVGDKLIHIPSWKDFAAAGGDKATQFKDALPADHYLSRLTKIPDNPPATQD
jgi:Domain of unknown function (DUF1906)